MAYLIAGPLVALVGIVAVFFVLRRKSVEKRSMYSARRSQIEHKVRAARQRTLTPRGRSERRHEEQTMAAPAYAPAEAQQTLTYEAPAYTAPPIAPPAPPPWETTSAPAPAPAPSFDYPTAAPAAPAEPAWNPPAPEPAFQPAPEPTPMPTPSEPSWTPAPAPAAEPVAPLEPAAATSASSTAAGWSVVNTDKDGAVSEQQSDGARKKGGGDTSSWQLASGQAPDMDAEEPQARRPNNLMAIAQYAVLVVGLVMVLIGVLVMVANSHVT